MGLTLDELRQEMNEFQSYDLFIEIYERKLLKNK
jgi:hypothetical protein